jgi:hypothetical protein
VTTLWPPNHRLVDVNATVTAIDDCSAPSVSLVSIVSTEPDDAEGTEDGNTVGDIQGADSGTPNSSFLLRAERNGKGEGRVYEVTYAAVDAAGNPASSTALVFVPHDLGGSTEPLLVSAENSLAGTTLRWSAVTEAVSYRTIRGTINALREAGNFIDLGTVACIQQDSAATSTQGSEDAEIPPLGETFFYLVAYNDGQDSGYGSDTATKPRIKTGGGCE